MEKHKKIIDKDMFNISQRLKKIDKDYFLVFDLLKKRYEVHHSNQAGGTYCLTSPYNSLDCRLIDYVYATSLIHNKNIIADIEQNNERLRIDAEVKTEEKIRSSLSDVYAVSSNSSKSYNIRNGFNTNWI